MPNRLVLIVEDEETVARALQRLAQRAGFVVAVDPTGGSVVQMATELRPVCIVLDLGLPGHDGRDLLAELKRNAATSKIPVVMQSGNESQLSRLLCFKLGAADYEVKPPSPTMFENLARRYLAEDAA